MGLCPKDSLLQRYDSQGATIVGFQGRYGVTWQFDYIYIYIITFVSEGHPNFIWIFFATCFFHHALRRFSQLIPLLLGHTALQIQYPRPDEWGLNHG